MRPAPIIPRIGVLDSDYALRVRMGRGLLLHFVMSEILAKYFALDTFCPISLQHCVFDTLCSKSLKNIGYLTRLAGNHGKALRF